MALTLPSNFENDIQGRDTALIPLVVKNVNTNTTKIRAIENTMPK